MQQTERKREEVVEITEGMLKSLEETITDHRNRGHVGDYVYL